MIASAPMSDGADVRANGPTPTMADNKATIIDAALAAGLIQSEAEGESMTKATLLDLWKD